MMIRITTSVPTPMYTSTPFSQPSHQSKRSAPATSATTVQITSATPPSMTKGVPAARPRVTASSVRPGGREGSVSVGFVGPSSLSVWSVMRRGIPGRRTGKPAPRVSPLCAIWVKHLAGWAAETPLEDEAASGGG
jgi:hypothetical protein